MSQSNDGLDVKRELPVWCWAVLALVLWVAYFALAYPPGGAPFIYAEF